MNASVLDNEAAGREALHQYRLLALAPERAADDLTALVSFICGTPLALLVPEGFASGTVGVLDPLPQNLTPEQQTALEILTRQVADHLALQRVAAALAEAVGKGQPLYSIVPICMYCKGLRDNEECWRRLEDYLRAHNNMELSHGICPTCLQIHHPEHAARR
jgi:hypothetical protein